MSLPESGPTMEEMGLAKPESTRDGIAERSEQSDPMPTKSFVRRGDPNYKMHLQSAVDAEQHYAGSMTAMGPMNDGVVDRDAVARRIAAEWDQAEQAFDAWASRQSESADASTESEDGSGGEHE